MRISPRAGGPRARGRRRTPARSRARRGRGRRPATAGADEKRRPRSGSIRDRRAGSRVTSAGSRRARELDSRRSAATSASAPGHRRPVSASSASARVLPDAARGGPARAAGTPGGRRPTTSIGGRPAAARRTTAPRAPAVDQRDVPPHAADAEAGHCVERLGVEPRAGRGPANRHGEGGRDDPAGGVDAARRGEQPRVAYLAHARGRRRRRPAGRGASGTLRGRRRARRTPRRRGTARAPSGCATRPPSMSTST